MFQIVTPEELQPSKIYPPIGEVKNDDLTKYDMMNFIESFIDQNGLVGHNKEGYNELIEIGINRIMTELFDIDRMFKNDRTQTTADQKCKSHQILFNFSNIKIGRPTCTTYFSCQYTDLHPSRARLTGLPYAGQITLSATVTLRAHFENHIEEKIAEIPPFQIGGLPIMIGSDRCHTNNMTREGLKAMGEDPTDPGGYFIMKQNEYVVDLLENIRYNTIHTHAKMEPNEHVRSEFLSQPGGAFENSAQVRIRYMTNGQITIEINSTKFEKVRLPFFIIYRIFGMTSDLDIANTILFDIEDQSPITKSIIKILEQAFQLADTNFSPLITVIEREKVIQMTAERVARYINSANNAYQTNETAIQYLNEDILKSLDRVFLPHIGQTPESRIRKLRFLGLIIYKTLLVHLKILSPTDRDSYKNKRVHGAGISLAKAFKTQVNISVIIPILRALRRELKNNPWESISENSIIDTFKNSLVASDLNRAMEQSITSGNKTIVVRRRAATNRVSSQALERKNVLNTYSALRTVVTQNAGNASKQTERADMMRRVHPTYTGFICISQSADTGEVVGMRKQLALTAGVCLAGEALPLKMRLFADPEVIALDDVKSERMLKENLSRVFINGEWIGCCLSSHKLVTRYRLLRREGKIIDPFTTIYWDPISNEVEFWLDVGRLKRPLLIVDNNLDEVDAGLDSRSYPVDAENHGAATSHTPRRGAATSHTPRRGAATDFVQNIRFTKKHVYGIITGTIKLDDLVKEGIVEYITPEEQENCLIAESIDVLFEHKHNILRRYTHCDIEQAIFGLAALISTFGNHTQPARVTLGTNQSRQTGGWYALNFPFRLDKNRFFQFYNEIPLVRTFTHKLVPANGTNVIIAYASYGGDNQEDSAIVCQASADRGLFAGAFYKFESAELEKGEIFCNPDALTTTNLKPNASYEKLVDGFIKVGSIVRNGDVIIGRVAKLNKSKASDDNNYIYTDRSIIYRLQEPAYVVEVLHPRGANDELFGIVKLKYERPLRTGDKMSSRSGNKSIVASMLSQSDMPFTESGITPDIIINTHSFPSRMTIGQLIETTLGKVCAQKGIISDGTAFLPVDHIQIAKDLQQLGFRYNGKERMYNGMTGEYFNSAIFIGPTAEQRLQKFVLDDEQSVAGSGPTDATTGQPLGGKNIQGGLRMGEMENHTIQSHGSMFNLYEKTHIDSDGRVIYVCRMCGNLAIYNEYQKIYQCRTCNELADISAVESSKTAILLYEELAASNVNVCLGLQPREFEKRS